MDVDTLDVRLRDDRSLNEIPFALDLASGQAREGAAGRVREIFRSVHVHDGSGIILLGCTGLVYKLTQISGWAGQAVEIAKFVRGHMSGSGIGLPCYVPPSKYCLVHDIVGGLQRGQRERYPEGLLFCSRELSETEKASVAAVTELIDDAGKTKAKQLGLELEEAVDNTKPTAIAIVSAEMQCPEHKQIDWRCRYCLAATIVNGPLEPETFVEIVHGETPHTYDTPAELPRILQEVDTNKSVTVFVQVKRWTRRLTED